MQFLVPSWHRGSKGLEKLVLLILSCFPGTQTSLGRPPSSWWGLGLCKNTPIPEKIHTRDKNGEELIYYFSIMLLLGLMLLKNSHLRMLFTDYTERGRKGERGEDH
jgi:hypothetical protein